MTRILAKDGAKYFGPYTDVGAVYETLELIKKVFPLRTCKMAIKEGESKIRPCLNYHIGLCSAPCAGLDTKEQYGKTVQDIIDLLSGKDRNIVKNMKENMERAAENLEFEKAASLRDKIIAVEKIVEKQKIITGNFEDEDIISVFTDETDSCAMVFFVRDGKVVGREHYMLEDTAGEEKGEILSNFLKSFYGGTAFIPKNIFVPEIEDGELLEQWLTMKRGSKVWIKVPQRGEKKDLLSMVTSNARLTLEQFRTKLKQDKEIHKVALKELADLLDFEDMPNRIEAYDISNIQGVDSVGSMVVFEGGKAKNSDYRRFKIKTVLGANDYDSMREILTRRFQHGLEEIEKIKERNLESSVASGCAAPGWPASPIHRGSR
jgi:excinuclease ABC subunit C